jgi:hypothetical protein
VTVELIRKREPSPDANVALIKMLRDVLALAEAGDIDAAAIAYASSAGGVDICYEADGYEAQIACAARQIDDELRGVLFFPEGE